MHTCSWQGREAVRHEVLVDYVRRKTGGSTGSMQELFHALEAVLDGIRRGTDLRGRSRGGGSRR